MAAMSGTRRKFAGDDFLRVVFLLLLGCGEGSLTVYAQGADAGKLYLDRKESDVKKIAGNATLNDANCDNLNGCNGSVCSRVTCQPISGESFLCSTVDNNELYGECPSGACRNKILLDYNTSFVTLPAPASLTLETEVARDICLQRPLESTFKDVSLQSEYALVYFGSTSGPFRAFPGREQNDTQCTTFDTRKRPWYLNGISVSKDVKILVDVSSTMGSVLPVDYKTRRPQNTYLDVAKNITLGLMQTFLAQDYVEVFYFDSSNAVSLGGAIQISSSYDYLNPAGRPELATLGASVNNLTASPNATPSNLNTAIVQAVKSFTTVNKLKVIVVLSDGLFVPLNSSTFPSVELKSLQAKLMVYKLPTNGDGGDPYLLKTSLQQNLCSVNGSFERLNAFDTANPLYSMRSYFTFLARTQLASVDNNATWSPLYSSFSQDVNAITVTYPAFGSDGLLRGVAGVDVIVDNLAEPLKSLVYTEFQSRKRGTQAPAKISLTCNYQSAPANSVCAGSTPPDSSAICPKTDSRPLADRVCCGYDTCGAVEGPKGGSKTWIIVGSVLGAVALVAAGLVARYFYHRYQNQRDPRRDQPPLPQEPLPFDTPEPQQAGQLGHHQAAPG